MKTPAQSLRRHGLRHQKRAKNQKPQAKETHGTHLPFLMDVQLGKSIASRKRVQEDLLLKRVRKGSRILLRDCGIPTARRVRSASLPKSAGTASAGSRRLLESSQFAPAYPPLGGQIQDPRSPELRRQ